MCRLYVDDAGWCMKKMTRPSSFDDSFHFSLIAPYRINAVHM